MKKKIYSLWMMCKKMCRRLFNDSALKIENMHILIKTKTSQQFYFSVDKTDEKQKNNVVYDGTTFATKFYRRRHVSIILFFSFSYLKIEILSTKLYRHNQNQTLRPNALRTISRKFCFRKFIRFVCVLFVCISDKKYGFKRYDPFNGVTR